ncbi:GNAT family N-acetyltransferase [Kribbella sp. NPDC051770]|uniref:GNAT family N-acetyltransferase n=1 Tax=Kribbella sp. NPDC051770 TaxID=3155413 RepID=UPI003447539C
MLLRAMERPDLGELLVLQEEGAVLGLAEVFPQAEYPFPRDSIRDRWAVELDDPAIRAWVAVDDAGLVGFAATRYDELLHFGTAVRSWGSGAASELHDAALGTLRGEWPGVHLHVFEGNHRARRFYAKHGWVATGSSKRSAYEPRPVLLEYRLEL